MPPVQQHVVPDGVLAVEDDPNLRRLIGRILKAQGDAVLEAGGSQEAIELCRTHSSRLDLLITDIVIPKMNGPELAAQLKTLNSNLKVLFVSGYGECEHRRPALLDREAPFLQKPFTTYELARKVRDLCDSGTPVVRAGNAARHCQVKETVPKGNVGKRDRRPFLLGRHRGHDLSFPESLSESARGQEREQCTVSSPVLRSSTRKRAARRTNGENSRRDARSAISKDLSTTSRTTFARR
jgi:CheY-like chemotaxis protein